MLAHHRSLLDKKHVPMPITLRNHPGVALWNFSAG